MNSSFDKDTFAKQLLNQDQPLNESHYEEYRMKLENSLLIAERRERLVGRIAVVSFALAMVLMFVCGSQLFGSADPWDKNATFISVGLGVIHFLAACTFPVALASYYSRFRPKVAHIENQIRDATMLAIQSEVAELRKQIESLLKERA